MQHLSWLCLGAGAIGTYIGGSLALAGEDVVFVERPPVVEALLQRGLRLDLSGDRRRSARQPLRLASPTVSFAPSVEAALGMRKFNAAIFALKSFDTANAVQNLRPFRTDLPPICCFSNGVENELFLEKGLGEGSVVAATVTSAIARKQAGDIVLEKARGIGIWSRHKLSDRLYGAARSALLHPAFFANSAAMKWSKMLSNLIGNPTSAILDMPPAQVFEHPPLYRIEVAALRECLAVMRAQGIPVVDLPGIPVRLLAWAARLPVWISKALFGRMVGGARGGKMPSFYIDLHAGRGKSEVGFLHGAVARFGARHGVPTPICAGLTEILLGLTDGSIPLEEFAGKPGKLVSALQP